MFIPRLSLSGLLVSALLASCAPAEIVPRAIHITHPASSRQDIPPLSWGLTGKGCGFKTQQWHGPFRYGYISQSDSEWTQTIEYPLYERRTGVMYQIDDMAGETINGAQFLVPLCPPCRDMDLSVLKAHFPLRLGDEFSIDVSRQHPIPIGARQWRLDAMELHVIVVNSGMITMHHLPEIFAYRLETQLMDKRNREVVYRGYFWWAPALEWIVFKDEFLSPPPPHKQRRHIYEVTDVVDHSCLEGVL